MDTNEKDKTEFAKVMYSLAGNFGGVLDKADLSLRFEVLKEYQVEKIKHAAIWLLKNRENTFPAIPTTKEIIDAIKKVSGAMSEKTTADLECDKVLKNLKYFGRECNTVFKNKTTQYLMSSRWNFYKLGMMSDDDLKWWRKDFITAHQEIAGQEPAFLDTASKAGMIPASNLKKLLPGAE